MDLIPTSECLVNFSGCDHTVGGDWPHVHLLLVSYLSMLLVANSGINKFSRLMRVFMWKCLDVYNLCYDKRICKFLRYPHFV